MFVPFHRPQTCDPQLILRTVIPFHQTLKTKSGVTSNGENLDFPPTLKALSRFYSNQRSTNNERSSSESNGQQEPPSPKEIKRKAYLAAMGVLVASSALLDNDEEKQKVEIHFQIDEKGEIETSNGETFTLFSPDEKRSPPEASSEGKDLQTKGGATRAARVTLGSLLGFSAGYVGKKSLKVLLLLLGGEFIILQVLAYLNYIEINWSSLDSSFKKIEGRSSSWADFFEQILTFNIPFKGKPFFSDTPSILFKSSFPSSPLPILLYLTIFLL